MRQVVTALIAMTCFAYFASQPAQAQLPKAVSVGIVNMTDQDVIVQGYTAVNGVKRGGQALVMNKKTPGKYETNVPGTLVRYYTVIDGRQPGRILLKDFPVTIPNRDVALKLVTSRTNPKMLELVPADQP